MKAKTTESQHFSMLKFLDGHSYYLSFKPFLNSPIQAQKIDLDICPTYICSRFGLLVKMNFPDQT